MSRLAQKFREIANKESMAAFSKNWEQDQDGTSPGGHQLEDGGDGGRFWPDRGALRVVRAACTFLSKGS